MKVLGNRLMLKVRENNKEVIKTSGGVVLPSGTNLDTDEVGYEVLEIGTEVKGIKVGNRVIPVPRSGYAMKVEEGKVLFINVQDILCII